MLRKIYDSLLTLAYPQPCQICKNSVEDSADGVVCRLCWEKTRLFTDRESLCAKCGAYLNEQPNARTARCHRCDNHFYDVARAVGLYDAALAASILHLKNEPFVARRLKKLLLAAYAAAPFRDADVLVPIPLSRQRLLERGFNQAEILGGILTAAAGLPLDKKTLVREIDTPAHRAAMDQPAREASVENAFAVKRPNLVRNRRILLVDDVFTSGATASNCAKVLKQKGATRVYVLTVARA